MKVVDSSLSVLEEHLRAAKTLAISVATGLASHIAAILVVLHLVGWWWKPCQKPLWLVGAILRVEVLVVSPLMASGEMALFLLQNLSGRRADARREFAMFLIMHLFFANKPFLPECFWITPLWEQQDLYLCISPGAGFFVVEIEWFRVVKSLRSVYFLVLECNLCVWF